MKIIKNAAKLIYKFPTFGGFTFLSSLFQPELDLIKSPLQKCEFKFYQFKTIFSILSTRNDWFKLIFFHFECCWKQTKIKVVIIIKLSNIVFQFSFFRPSNYSNFSRKMLLFFHGKGFGAGKLVFWVKIWKEYIFKIWGKAFLSLKYHFYMITKYLK